MTLRVSVLKSGLFATLACGAVICAHAQGFRTPAGTTGPLRSAPGVDSRVLTVPPAEGRPSLPRQADYIVAVVNSEPITNNEVMQRVVNVEQQIGQRGSVPPRAVLRREVLEQLITEKAQLQLAKESKVTVDDSEVDRAEENLARRNQMEIAELRRRLAADGMSAERFRADLRSQLVRSKQRDREVESRVKVTDVEVDQFIREQQQSTDVKNVELNLGHILVVVPEGASAERVAELQARAQTAADQAKAGGDFAALARDFSDAAERSSGGLLGLRPTDRLPQLFVDSTRNLRVGGIVGPVRSAAGFHVLKVVERVRGGMPGAVVTQHHVRHILLRPNAQLSEAQARAQLAGYKSKILAGEAEFGALARQHSQDGSAKDGGDLGWSNPGQFVPEFEEVVNTMKPGDVSDPVVSRFGVHLIGLVERREATLNQKEQRELARNVLKEKKIEEAYATWARDLRARAYVEYREAPQ